jgi:7-cyano-7-deazaguanine synthase
MTMRKAIVILSGGMDSTTLLYKVVHDIEFDIVSVLSMDYGQRHKKELDVAAATCAELKLPHKIIDISGIKAVMKNSALTDDIEVPEGHYEEPSMKVTVVPNRNAILLSLAVAEAVSHEAGFVFYGAHSGDHAIYPDCRREFVEAFNDMAAIANYEPVEILVPFIDMDKGDILKIGYELEVDYAQTWTCYAGRAKACGKCGACVERLEAFESIGESDPLEYEDILRRS